MRHEEALGPSTDYRESVATSFKAQEGQAYPATSGSTHTYLGRPRQLTATPGGLPELSSLPAGGKPERSTEFREHQSRSPGFFLWSRREIAEVTVQVAILVAVIWFVLMWTGVAIPTQRYPEYAVDFNRQLKVRGGSNLPISLSSVIPCAPLQLVIHLGRGNQPGPFDVALVQDGMRYAFASGTAKLENHETILRVKLDLSHVPAGKSQLGIRPAGWEWKYYKVILKSDH